jgi:hypothetical protein
MASSLDSCKILHSPYTSPRPWRIAYSRLLHQRVLLVPPRSLKTLLAYSLNFVVKVCRLVYGVCWFVCIDTSRAFKLLGGTSTEYRGTTLPILGTSKRPKFYRVFVGDELSGNPFTCNPVKIFKCSSPWFAFFLLFFFSLGLRQIQNWIWLARHACSDGRLSASMSRIPGKLSLLVGICAYQNAAEIPCTQKATQQLFQSLSSFYLHHGIVLTSR